MQKSLLRNAVAATFILLSGVAVAEAQTAPASTPSPAAAAAPVTAAAPAEPAAAPVAAATPAPAPEKVATVAKPRLSACARAILASERKLDHSSADSATIASAWQHIEEARKSRGQACREQARQAADML